MQMDTDSRLIHKMKSGDRDAIDAFVRKYYPSILKYCRFHTWDMAAAEDLTQDVFVNFLEALDAYEHKGKAANYLYVIARNLCKNSRKGKNHMSIEAMDKKTFQELRAEDDIDAATERLEVERAVKRLPDRLREVVVLYYLQGMKQREISAICGIGLPLVQYRLRQAKKKLRAWLDTPQK